MLPSCTGKSELTTIVHYGWELIAQALAKGGSSLEENVILVQSGCDDFALQRSSNVSCDCNMDNSVDSPEACLSEDLTKCEINVNFSRFALTRHGPLRTRRDASLWQMRKTEYEVYRRLPKTK